MVGEKDPSGQVKRMQCLGSVEGSCQQGEVRLGEFLSLPEQARGGSVGAAVTRNAGTPPGTYNMAVTGTFTSGSTTLTHNVTLTLTVS
jgi:hypothetical protein